MKAKGSQFAMQPDGPVYHGSAHGFAAGDTIDPITKALDAAK